MAVSLQTSNVLSGEKSDRAGAAALSAKGETSQAELEQLKAEIAYRVAHAKLEALVTRGRPAL